ncbi:MAG TPA: BamA/TamA family outer membrane protein [Longimicrobiales bacterium]|nr:BamA/TamA family outer membrane protein [Longimicrobiales bacterium]
MKPRRSFRVASALLCWLVAAPLSAQSRPEVVDLEFVGARAFTEQDLAAAIVTAETRCPSLVLWPLCLFGVAQDEAYLDPEVLQADALRLRAFYYERGFRNTLVVPETEAAGDGVRVRFRIAEGSPVLVKEVRVVGAPPGFPARTLPLAPGQPFDLLAREAGRDTLLQRLRNGGYARAQVLLGSSIGSDDPYAATVTYDVIAGNAARIGAVEILGTEESSPDLVRRMLTFREGDLYDRSALLESQRNLYGLQIYRHAEIRADLAAEPDSVVPVRIQLAEGAMRRVRFGGGVNTVECANVEGRWTSRNFMGGGRRLEVRGRVGNLLVPECEQYLDPLWTLDDAYDRLTGLVSVDYTQPWFFGPRNTIGGGVFMERRSLPEVFVRSAVGGYVSVGRSLGRGAGVTLGYRPELTELRTEGDLFFCVSFIACAYEDIQLLREPHWLSPVALSLAVDRTDALFTPSAGFVVRADLEHAAPYTGSDFAYTRLLAEGSTYTGDQGGVVLAARLRSGVAWPHQAEGTRILRLNPQKRFFAGGSNSVRGFAPFQLGPTVLGIDAVTWLAEVDTDSTEVVEGAGCTLAQINDASCDPTPLAGRPGAFEARPAGGEVLLEASVELRFPLPIGAGKLRGAAFLDAGQVWATARVLDLDELAGTPGLGVRYLSPVGPVRMDLGLNLQGPRSLPVLTTVVEECTRTTPGCVSLKGERAWLRNTDEIVVLNRGIEYQPFTAPLDSWEGLFQRLQLHFAIGQAF